MKTLTLDQQKRQNNELLTNRLNGTLSRIEVIEFCKRAKINVEFDLIDSDVQDAFLNYYGFLPQWSSNNNSFTMINLR